MELRYYFCFLALSEIVCGFMIFRCCNYGTIQSQFVNKLNQRTRRSWVRGTISYTFFHSTFASIIFYTLKSWNSQAFSFLMPKKASNKTASFIQFLNETYEQYEQKIKDGSRIPVKPHVFAQQDYTSHFSSIMLHSKISCLNCTRASWKGKAFLSKDNSPFCSFT